MEALCFWLLFMSSACCRGLSELLELRRVALVYFVLEHCRIPLNEMSKGFLCLLPCISTLASPHPGDAEERFREFIYSF